VVPADDVNDDDKDDEVSAILLKNSKERDSENNYHITVRHLREVPSTEQICLWVYRMWIATS